jgi:hypothetical protein
VGRFYSFHSKLKAYLVGQDHTNHLKIAFIHTFTVHDIVEDGTDFSWSTSFRTMQRVVPVFSVSQEKSCFHLTVHNNHVIQDSAV